MRSKMMSRRALLRTLGASAAVAPFFPAHLVTAGAPAPKRLFVFWTPNGLMYSEYKPDGGETDFTLRKILSPLQKYQQRMLVLQNLNIGAYFKYPINNDHTPSVMGLTGTKIVRDKAGQPSGDGPSVDQYVAQRLGRVGSFDGLVVGVEAYAPLFFRRSREKVDPRLGAKNVFKSLFGATSGTSAADSKSVIDIVRPELLTLQKRLAGEDRRKIDAHLDHIRTLELRLTATQATSTTASACAKMAPPLPDKEPADYPTRASLMLDVVALAMKCDLTRVASFAWFGGGGAANIVFDWLDARGRHHDLSHAGAVKPGRSEYDALTKIGAYFAGLLGGFLDQLDAVDEGGRTMAENTVAFWTTEHAGNHPMSEDHARKDVPHLFVGSCGGYFKTGRNLDMMGRSANQAMLSLVHAMGFEDDTAFGDPEVCPGPLPGLT